MIHQLNHIVYAGIQCINDLYCIQEEEWGGIKVNVFNGEGIILMFKVVIQLLMKIAITLNEDLEYNCYIRNLKY